MPRPPKFDLPPGACDSHIHVYGEKSCFPSMPVNGREMEDHLLASTEEDLPLLAERMSRLPVQVVVDHIGSIRPESGLHYPAFADLMKMVDGGKCWVKLSAAYQLSRVGAPCYSDYRAMAIKLVEAAPDRMLWGTNWPHPKVKVMPNDTDLLETVLDWSKNDAVRKQILVDNPTKLYGFPND